MDIIKLSSIIPYPTGFLLTDMGILILAIIIILVMLKKRGYI